MEQDLLAPEPLRRILGELYELRAELRHAEVHFQRELSALPEAQRAGARNLIHYVTFRRIDVRALQSQLAALGLSSLGRSEARIEPAISSVIRVLQQLVGEALEPQPELSQEQATHRLHEHTTALLGRGQPCVIMVTLPGAAALDPGLVRELLKAGMGVARINCAHDDESAWRAMAQHVRTLSAELACPCKILFDLPGPKLRTLAIEGDQEVVLTQGDTLVLSGAVQLGRPARTLPDGTVEPACVACALPQAVAALAPGAPVFFDDGKIAAQVRELREQEAVLTVTRAGQGTAKLRAEKGINLPETELPISALSSEDLAALEVAVQCADMVGLSFVRTSDDVRALHQELRGRESNLGVVLKVETKQGFENLPALLLTALHCPPVGVMIARGDLAVECGFERLAELQEEILWLCEAAHVPCIWATQVLDTLAKKGKLTRAEVTDAAMAERAECVMLNKGPHVVRAIKTLRNIVRRMRGHQRKKTAILRPLRTPGFG